MLHQSTVSFTQLAPCGTTLPHDIKNAIGRVRMMYVHVKKQAVLLRKLEMALDAFQSGKFQQVEW